MKIKLTCTEISLREADNYAVITFQSSSLDETLYIAGNVGVQTTMADAQRYQVGKSYGLDLQEISETPAP